MIQNFDEMLDRVKSSPLKTIVIAAAHTASAMDAAIMAYDLKLAKCILVGELNIIKNYLQEKVPETASEYEVIDCGEDLNAAAETSVRLVHEQRADLIMKGLCDSGTLLKAILDKDKGLRTNKIMSDVLAYETPDKIMLMGDGGFIPLPDITDKLSIIANCVQVAHALGNKLPRVAILTHSEMVSLKNQSTVDAAILNVMNKRGQIKGCIVDGPLAFDNAISREAAQIKGIDSEVAGDADILIVPNIEAGNIFGKSITYYCKYRVAHVVLGAKVPVLIASRADSAEIKMLTMALGIITCGVC
ncbi:MAG: phosphate acyltransferase [Candidatus Stygibacter australis]|nr:phosphate acyltransferase [Candidatus Stygibacter australis]MDP8320982.1 phosphate acyltransferase [Candidatus Stygibacter australis]